MGNPTTRVHLANGTEAKRWPVFDWRQCKVSQKEFGPATCELTVRQNSKALQDIVNTPTKGDEAFEWQLQVFHNNAASPVFAGPVHTCRFSHAGHDGSAYITLIFNNHISEALRRRMNFSADHADVQDTDNVDDIATHWIDNAMGGISGPTSPTGYPGGVGRGDFNSYTYTSETSLPGAHATSITWDEQSGNQVLGAIERLCDQYDLCLEQNRTSASTYEIVVDTPYQNNDYSDRVTLALDHATSGGYDYQIPYVLANVVRAAGAGSGASQTDVYDSDATSVTNRGVYEGHISIPGGTSGMATIDSGYIKDRMANPVQSYKVRLLPKALTLFNASSGRTFYWRDTVGVLDRKFGYTQYTEQTIVSFDLVSTNGGVTNVVDIEIEKARRDVFSQMLERTGTAPAWTGGRGRDNRGG